MIEEIKQCTMDQGKEGIHMGEFFNVNNKFFQAVNKIVDCVCLSMIWILACLPIVTAGAATTALYYTVNKVIRHGRGYLWGEFWGAFRSNFKQSTIVWLIQLLIMAILAFDGYIMYHAAQAGEKSGVLYMLFIAMFVLLLMWQIYLFPYMARFENTTKMVLKNSALIAIANVLKTLLMFVLLAAAVLAVYVFMPLILVVPTLYMLFVNFIMEKIFLKYMSEEDIAAEEERNREFYN